MSSGHDGCFYFGMSLKFQSPGRRRMGKAKILENVMGVKRDLGLVRSRTEFSKGDWCLGLVLSLTKPASASLQ